MLPEVTFMPLNLTFMPPEVTSMSLNLRFDQKKLVCMTTTIDCGEYAEPAGWVRGKLC